MTTFDTGQPKKAVNPAGATSGATGAADTPGTPAVPDIDSIASTLQGLITQMEATVPDLRPHDKRVISRVAAAARYARDLIPPAITTVTTVPGTPAGILDAGAGQRALDYHARLFPLAQRAQAFTEALLFSINSELATHGEGALQMYQWAKRAVKGPNGSALQPYLDEMVRVVKKANNKRKVKPGTNPAPSPEPSPTPAPSPTPSPSPAPQGFLAAFPATGQADDDFPRSIYDLVDDDLLDEAA
jgi:hypothetical protein